jgi:hypothetical protein
MAILEPAAAHNRGEFFGFTPHESIQKEKLSVDTQE